MCSRVQSSPTLLTVLCVVRLKSSVWPSASSLCSLGMVLSHSLNEMVSESTGASSRHRAGARGMGAIPVTAARASSARPRLVSLLLTACGRCPQVKTWRSAGLIGNGPSLGPVPPPLHTDTWTHTHSHSHTLTLTLTHTLTHTLAYSHTHSLTHTHTYYISHTHTHIFTHTYTHSYTLTHTFTHTHAQFLAHTHTQTHTHIHTLTHTLSLSHTHTFSLFLSVITFL